MQIIKAQSSGAGTGLQQRTLLPLAGSTIGTTETVFQFKGNQFEPSHIVPLGPGVTGLWQGTGRVMWFHVEGTLTGATPNSTTLLIRLYQVPASSLPLAPTVVTAADLVAAGGTEFAQSVTGATPFNSSTAGTFSMDAYLQLDAEGNLQGTVQNQIFGEPTAAFIQVRVGGLAGEQDINLAVAAQLGDTESGVQVTLTSFSIAVAEQVSGVGV